MVDQLLDVGNFRSWALGNLVDNATRGWFAEWLVGKALGIIGDDDTRVEWDSVDLRDGEVTIEVKTSGLSQSWNPMNRSTPSFKIPPRKSAWDAATDTWESFDPPRRTADVYVFCLHQAVPATNAKVLDPACWTFWVIPTDELDEQLGPQQTVRVSTLNRLAARVGWSELRAAVDQCSLPGSSRTCPSVWYGVGVTDGDAAMTEDAVRVLGGETSRSQQGGSRRL